VGGGVRRVALITALALTATVTGGCQYLFSAFGAPYPVPSYDPSMSFDPGASYDPNSSDPPYAGPKPIATFTKGKVTLSVDKSAPITLDHLSAGPHIFQDFGTSVTWSGAEGWYVSIDDSIYGGTDETSIRLDRITGGQHWAVDDTFTTCILELTHAPDKTGVAGTASCHGLRWADTMAVNPGEDQPPYVTGQDPFDLELSFSAS
jgi:hypothetical protein